jgi:hypothetical protein
VDAHGSAHLIGMHQNPSHQPVSEVWFKAFHKSFEVNEQCSAVRSTVRCIQCE